MVCTYPVLRQLSDFTLKLYSDEMNKRIGTSVPIIINLRRKFVATMKQMSKTPQNIPKFIFSALTQIFETVIK